MYSNSMTRINRSPDGGESAGNLGSSEGSQGSASGQNGAGASAGGESGAGQPQYVSKADFDALRNDFTSKISQFSRSNQSSDSSNKKPSDPSNPNIKDYDFQKDPEALDRYNRDVYKYHRHLERQEEAKEKGENEARDKARGTIQGHRQRMSEFQKANPEAAEALKKAGAVEVLDDVKFAVYASKSSAEIVHYLSQHKEVARELDEIAEVEGLDSLRYRVGEISATIKAEAKLAEAQAAAAKDRPPRQNFRGNSGSANRKPSLEERFSRFHSPK